MLSESLGHLHSKLQKAGLENQEISARIAKLTAEAEKTLQEARIAGAEADQMEFINLVKRLRLVLEAQRAMTFADFDETDFLSERIDTMLKALEKLTGE